MVDKYDIALKSVLETFNLDLLIAIVDASPSTRQFLTVIDGNSDANLLVSEFFDGNAVSTGYSSQEIIDNAHEVGAITGLWGPPLPEWFYVFYELRGLDFIFSDYPADTMLARDLGPWQNYRPPRNYSS